MDHTRLSSKTFGLLLNAREQRLQVLEALVTATTQHLAIRLYVIVVARFDNRLIRDGRAHKYFVIFIHWKTE